MKRLSTFFASGALLALIVGTASAQTAAPPATTTVKVQPGAAPIGKLDEKTTGNTVRASQLMGADIENAQGEEVGEISDIVLDSNGGKVRYAAVTYGGLMGIGDKLFAVPWEAFRCVQDPDDADEYNLVLDVTPEKLKGATGFDQETWPNFADQSFTTELDTRYGVKRDVDVNVKVQPRR
ncbi:PRC-barrel domain-containing protein [Lacipirellula sp.]|uniref:PRC-barrel domain-containing protein n=1 Tax=Lacipirellula sp. TaxID=2691419 RepID=UPI003D0D61C0